MGAKGSATPDLAQVFRHLPMGLLTLDAHGVVTSMNPAASVILAAPADAIGSELARFPSFAQAGLPAGLASALREGAPAHLLAVPSSPPGLVGERLIDLEVSPLPPGGGAPSGAIVLVTDVTDRVQELARARLFYQSFLHSHEPMEVTDRRGTLVDVNPAFERTYGFSRAECIGRRPQIVRSPKTPAATYEGLWRDLLDPSVGRWAGELINLDRQGREHPVLLTINAIRDEAGAITHFIGVATDLSERKAFEQQVARADRLASLGQLAAGVAHELNTPLANIMLIAESLRRRAPNPWVAGRADAITQQVDSAARIVGGLLDFSRYHPPDVDRIDLVAALREAIGFARGKQSPEVEISESHEVEPLWIRGNRVQLLQVFVNIINNAVDAMQGHGQLRTSSGREDRTAWVRFADTGPGIPPSVLPHIFEPFFTTKSEGKGTGLGLAIVHGIVQAHGGTITVDSRPGEGATFEVRFPSSPDGPPAGPDDERAGAADVA